MDDFFKTVTLAMCTTLDVQEALEAALPAFAAQLPMDGLGLGYSDVDRGRMEVVAWAGSNPPWSPTGEGFQMDREGADYVEFDGTRAPSPLIVNRPTEVPPGLFALFPGLRTNSVVFLRLVLDGQEVGALIVWAEGVDRYDQSHAELLASVVQPLTLAMVNARRFRELREAKQRLEDDHRALVADLQNSVGSEIVGADFGLRGVMEQVRRIAHSNRPALLLGETGTGKEVIANALHVASPRQHGSVRVSAVRSGPGHPAGQRAVRSRAWGIHRRRRNASAAGSSALTAAPCSWTKSAS